MQSKFSLFQHHSLFQRITYILVFNNEPFHFRSSVHHQTVNELRQQGVLHIKSCFPKVQCNLELGHNYKGCCIYCDGGRIRTPPPPSDCMNCPCMWCRAFVVIVCTGMVVLGRWRSFSQGRPGVWLDSWASAGHQLEGEWLKKETQTEGFGEVRHERHEGMRTRTDAGWRRWPAPVLWVIQVFVN